MGIIGCTWKSVLAAANLCHGEGRARGSSQIRRTITGEAFFGAVGESHPAAPQFKDDQPFSFLVHSL